MAKNRTKTISSWDELCKFVESINPYSKTIVLTGFVNYLERNGRTRVRHLVFSTKPVSIIKKK